MAQACQNIGKEFSSSSSTSPTKRIHLSSPNVHSTSKQRKSLSPIEGKKSLKRLAPPSSSSSISSKKFVYPSSVSIECSSTPIPSFTYPPSPYLVDSLFRHHLTKCSPSPSFNSPILFDSLFLHHLNKSRPSPSLLTHSLNSPFSSKQRSTYLMESILEPNPSFVCNWMESNLPERFCGQRFPSQLTLLEHLCTSHTSSTMKSPLISSYFPSLTKL